MKSFSGFVGKRSIAHVFLCGALACLGGCSSISLEQFAGKDGQTTQSFAAAKAEEPVNNQAVISAQEVTKLMSDSDWRYQNATLTGVIRYSADGRLLYYEDEKGRGTGRWRAEDGALCEFFEPSVAIPKGWPERCNKIIKTGDIYQIGNTSFVRISDMGKRRNWN
jgi:uncharacterized protein DUF995